MGMVEAHLYEILDGLRAKASTVKCALEIYNQIKEDVRIRDEYRQPKGIALAIVYLASKKAITDPETMPGKKKYYIRQPWTGFYLARAAGISPGTLYGSVKLINSIISKSTVNNKDERSTTSGTTKTKGSFGSGIARY